VKKCTRCHTEKTVSNFRYTNKARKPPLGYLSSWCRDCEKEYRLNYKSVSKNAKWVKLASNLSRFYGGYLPYAVLRDNIGPPKVCYLCGLPVSWDTAEMDHVQPRSRGGKNVIENLKWAHKICNRIKHNLTINEMVELFQEIINNQD